MKVAFIGAGNMGGALVLGVTKSVKPDEVIIFDPDRAKCDALSKKTGCVVADSAKQAVEKSEYVVLGVKPQVLRGVYAELVDCLDENKKVLSIAAGVTVETLDSIPAEKGKKVPTVRMLPNTPCEIGDGLIIYTGNDLVTDEIYAEIDYMFSKCGLVEKTTEHMIDVASAISGCTPAFAYMFIDALADGAVRCGVPRDKAIMYAAQVVKGSANMVLTTGRHPDALKDAVCSPGGSTIVGVATLEDGAFRATSANAVFYANEKNKKLG